MGITYTAVFADSTYGGFTDVRQCRDITLKVAKPLLDAGWVIRLNAFNSGAEANYRALNNKYALVLKSPDNLFSIGFYVITGNSTYHNFNIYLYSYDNMPSTVSEVGSKAKIKTVSHNLNKHPTIMEAVYTNVGLVELRAGGFCVYLTSNPSAITDDVFRAVFGILPSVHCSSGATINTIFIGDMPENPVNNNIFIYPMFYYADGAYKSEAISTKLPICYGGTNTNFEIIIPVVSYNGTFIIKSFYNCTRNNPDMIKGQTILLDNKPYIVLYSDSNKSYLLAI